MIARTKGLMLLAPKPLAKRFSALLPLLLSILAACSSAPENGTRCRVSGCLSGSCTVQKGQLLTCDPGSGANPIKWVDGAGRDATCSSKFECQAGNLCFALAPEVDGYFVGVCE